MENYNKYKAFKDAMELSNNEEIVSSCQSLINVAHQYYPSYEWYHRLNALEKRLSAYTPNQNNQQKKKKTLNITQNFVLLGCYDYVKTLQMKRNNNRYTFRMFLDEFVFSKDYISERSKKLMLFEEYEELDSNPKYSEIIMQSIKKCRKFYTLNSFSSKYYDNRMKSLETAVITYFDNVKKPKIDKETAFNSVFSDMYIKQLIEKIETNSCTIVIDIAPIRGLLTDRTLENNSHKYAFNLKKMRDATIFDKECMEKIKKFSVPMKNIEILNNWLIELENSIE